MPPFILSICGSYRQNGNTDGLLKKALRGAEQTGARTENIHLSDYAIEFCRGCMNCFKNDGLEVGQCSIKDDMTKIIVPKILECDGMILGTPSYWSNVSGLMKNFIDRMLPFTYNHGGCEPSPRLKPGKKAMLYVVAGVSHRVSAFEGIHYLPFETMRIYFRSSNIEVVDCLIASDVERAGDIDHQPELLEQAFEQGKSFASMFQD